MPDVPAAAKPYQFQKGKSGNPGGRPRGIEKMVRELVAAQHAKDKDGNDLDGWSRLTLRLFSIAMDGDNERESIAAAKLLYERAHGQAKQAVEVSGEIAPEHLALLEALRMTPHERRAALAQDSTAAEDDAAIAEFESEHAEPSE